MTNEERNCEDIVNEHNNNSSVCESNCITSASYLSWINNFHCNAIFSKSLFSYARESLDFAQPQYTHIDCTLMKTMLCKMYLRCYQISDHNCSIY